MPGWVFVQRTGTYMKKRIIAGMLIFYSFLLISCKNTVLEKKGMDGAAMMRPWYSETEKGVLFYGNTDRLYSYDVQAGKVQKYGRSVFGDTGVFLGAIPFPEPTDLYRCASAGE